MMGDIDAKSKPWDPRELVMTHQVFSYKMEDGMELIDVDE